MRAVIGLKMGRASSSPMAVARVPDVVVDAGRDELVVLLDGDEATEAPPEHEHRPHPERATPDEQRQTQVPHRITIDDPQLATIQIGAASEAGRRRPPVPGGRGSLS